MIPIEKRRHESASVDTLERNQNSRDILRPDSPHLPFCLPQCLFAQYFHACPDSAYRVCSYVPAGNLMPRSRLEDFWPCECGLKLHLSANIGKVRECTVSKAHDPEPYLTVGAKWSCFLLHSSCIWRSGHRICELYIKL